MAKLVELIYTTKLVGSGTPEDLFRKVHEFYTKEGELIAEIDSVHFRSELL